ncbi:histidine kinase [Ruminococcaceae bacterium OttesenSCG-928-L11]|nr:histidine kinase [Ruminococcaceae bacterium OttesenSCG-928-L11]
MPPKKTNYLPLLMLPIIIVVCLGLWSIQVTPLNHISSETATYDLRDIDFSESIANVNRTVEYVPGVLLTPDEFTAREDIIVGTIPEDVTVATMRIRLLLPEGIQYGLCGYSTNYASHVYVNGKWLFTDGKPGYSLAEESGRERYHFFSAEPQDGAIEIVIATSSFSHKDTFSGMEWCIGDYQKVRTFYVQYTYAPIVIMAWYVLLALVFLLLFLSLPAHGVNGWLTLLAVVMALRTGFSQSKPLLSLFPGIEWGTGFRIEKMAEPVMVILLLLIFHFEFPGMLPKWAKGIIIGISGTICVPYLLLDTNTLSHFSTINRLLLYILIAVMSLVSLLALRRRNTRPSIPQWIMFAGIVMILFASVWDLCYYGSNPLGAVFALMQPVMVIFSMFMLVSAMLTTLQKTADAENEAAKLRIGMLEKETEMGNARTAIMLSQIQPHFLYNTLAAIQDLCGTDAAQAETTVQDFSIYLRGNLDSLSLKAPILFEQELEHVELYISLEKKRFRERLQYEFDIQSGGFPLPALTLQPIVENAVHHGVTQRDEGGKVIIRSWEDDENWHIAVEDNGVGFDPSAPLTDDRTHIGISNVRYRLEVLCGGALEIQSTPGVGTIATITIPKGGKPK